VGLLQFAGELVDLLGALLVLLPVLVDQLVQFVQFKLRPGPGGIYVSRLLKLAEVPVGIRLVH